MYRTHTCAELRQEHEGEEVKLAGWVKRVRTHGPLTFIDLGDRYGVTQITVQNLDTIPSKESVVQIIGTVVVKTEPNKSLKTGKIEVKARSLRVLAESKPLPLDENATEETRLKYRYLDLRTNNVLDNLVFRSKVIAAAKNFCLENDFLEIETPLLVKSTPEGARDYMVASRVNKHQFYALPQSPQLYKQILMIGGADKYFQVARCLRDEDLRADRQPEHTQLDFEMSFVHQKDVQLFVQNLMRHVFKESLNVDMQEFPVFSYEESMSRFGSDKPDIRFGLELTNITDIVKDTDFKVFSDAPVVNCIYVGEEFSRKQIDTYTSLVKTYQAKGLAFVKVINKEFESGVSKFLDTSTQKRILQAVGANGDGTIFFVADKCRVSQTALGHLRNQLAKDLELTDSREFRFCWVNDFPLFAYNEEEQKWEPEHHMFSMPKEEFIDDFESRPGEVKGDLWDLVLNGWEMASGSIRVSNPKLQERILKFVGFDKEQAHEKFGFLLTAYEYGGPIHGGMGIGLDRLVAMMKGLTDIRQVIAFPKNKNAQCPMDESPGNISKEQLDELHIGLK